jgi:hypothetical protein
MSTRSRSVTAPLMPSTKVSEMPQQKFAHEGLGQSPVRPNSISENRNGVYFSCRLSRLTLWAATGETVTALPQIFNSFVDCEQF